ncbi:3-hydroxybutyrate oligomer hydrolase family protein [Coralloluteibacterium thermophilus]|uniref:3-hydroxybutyrate oligomer hydrolase family protein n=1 Tax=Coralloluteibacterium thermophilum TaxID=2707049 RepID=A0ABV9NJI1_9GAMM
MTRTSIACLSGLLGLAAAACAPVPVAPELPVASEAPRVTAHRAGDDLLTAGLGADGLRAAIPPAFADPAAPTAGELRRRAIWANWRGIADLAPGGGYGEVYGRLDPVPGREYHAYAHIPGARQPHRVLVQVPDAFDRDARCVVVAASSGSRGIYGAIALAGAWGLPRGCAVAYTDKGAGTGYVDLATGQGAGLDGRPATGAAREFRVDAAADRGVAVKHAHSQDNPEADWGLHVKQAATFALEALDRAFPDAPPHRFGNVRVIAVGVSNGGGAVLRAAEDGEGWLDGVVAISPNVHPGEGGRPLYDYATEAALLMPCALAAEDFDALPMARPQGAVPPAWRARCASLHAAGLLEATTPAAQAREAHARLRAAGWSDAALEAGALSVAFDLWRSIVATYASAYARTPAGGMPCGYAFRAEGDDPAQRAAWWADASGIPPGAGVALAEAHAGDGADPHVPGLLCLRRLWTGDGAQAEALRAGVAATRAGPPRPGLPVIVVHGLDDGLIPEAFSGGPYAARARAAGRDLRYWRVHHAQHFDAFLGLPALAARYVPLMPYAYHALDRMAAHLDGAPLPEDAEIEPVPRRPGETLAVEGLRLPE